MAGRARSALARPRIAFAWGLLLLAGLLGLHERMESNTRRFAGYWRAMAWVDELAKFKYPSETWDNLELGLRQGRGEVVQLLVRVIAQIAGDTTARACQHV